MNKIIKPLLCLTLLAYQGSSFAEQEKAEKSESKNSAYIETLASYGKALLVWSAIPFLTEYLLEYTQSLIPSTHSETYPSHLLSIHSDNVRLTSNTHTAERIRAFVQSLSFSLFDDRSQKLRETEHELHKRGIELQGRLGIEAGKARLAFAPVKAVFNSLVKEANYAVSYECDLERGAGILALGAFFIRFLHPELRDNDQDLLTTMKLHFADSLEKIDTAAFRALIMEALASLDADLTQLESMHANYESLLKTWLLESSDSETICSLDKNTTQAKKSEQSSYLKNGALLVGAFAPSLFFARTPFFIDKAVRFAARNIGDALMRPLLLDGISTGRRSLQSLGNEYKQASEAKAVDQTEATLRDAQARITGMLSERSLRMRANVMRLQALIVPKFISIHHKLYRNDRQGAVNTLADTLIYIRQFNPESSIEDHFIQVSAQAFLAKDLQSNPDLREELFLALADHDLSFAKDTTVRRYYETIFDFWNQKRGSL